MLIPSMCTGTPLGDPIEVGAVAAALSAKTNSAGRQPLRLISNKACYGHTEGAAGLSGLLLAAVSLGSRAAPPIMHLRSCNPHVALALGDIGQGSAVPLQPSGEPYALPHDEPRHVCIPVRACHARAQLQPLMWRWPLGTSHKAAQSRCSLQVQSML